MQSMFNYFIDFLKWTEDWQFGYVSFSSVSTLLKISAFNISPMPNLAVIYFGSICLSDWVIFSNMIPFYFNMLYMYIYVHILG